MTEENKIETKEVEVKSDNKYLDMLTEMQSKYNSLEQELNSYKMKEIEKAKEYNENLMKEAEKNKDVKSINENWERQFKEAKEKYEKEIQMKNSYIEKQLIDNVAINMANEISTAPELLLPHIKQRLCVQFDNEQPLTKVLDIHGNMSPYSVDDLKKEITDNKKFHQIIKSNNNSSRGYQQQRQNNEMSSYDSYKNNISNYNYDMNRMHSDKMPYNEIVRRETGSVEAAERRIDAILNRAGNVR